MLPITDFSGGLWLPPGDPAAATAQPGFAVPPNGLLEADNVEYLPSGGLRGRRGRVRLSSVYSGFESFVGAHRHYCRSGSVFLGPTTSYDATSYLQDPAGINWNNVASFGVSQVVDVTLNASEISRMLRIAEFGFAVPTNATITGIQVEVTRRATGTITDSAVRLFTGLSTYTDTDRSRSEEWAAADETVIYGGLGDTWGRTWTPAEINAVGSFGVGIVATTDANGSVATIVTVTMTVYYLAADRSPVTLVAMNVDVLGLSVLQHILLTAAGAWQSFPNFRPWRVAERVRYVPWPEQDAVFIFDGVNPLLRYDSPDPTGLQYGNMSIVEAAIGYMAPPLGPYAALWQSRLWATTPSEINFSVYGCEVNDPTTWSPDIQLSCNDPDGGKITGIVAFTASPSLLLILKDTALFYFLGDPVNGGQLVLFSRVGCIAPDSVQQTPWGCIYVGRSGVFVTDGQNPQPTEVSAPIASLFQQRDADVQYPDAVGLWHPTANQYWLKLDPAAADGYVLHFSGDGKARWSHMPAMPLQAGCTWNGSADAGEILICGSDGYAREADTGAVDDDGTEDGQAIPVAVRIAGRLLDDRSPLMREGRVTYVKPSYRGTQALTGSLRYNEDPARAVAFTAGAAGAINFYNARATITDLATFGRTVDVRLLNASDGPEFELHRIGLDAALRTVRQWR